MNKIAKNIFTGFYTRMKINNYNPNFTGYTNVFASELNTTIGKYSLLSMKLDDIGTKDLTAYKELKKMQLLPQEIVNKDTLTLLLTKVGDKIKILFFNDMRTASGKNLKSFERAAKTAQEIKNYKLEEKIHMKAYTFLAKLTRRLMNENHEIKRDVDFYKVLNSSQANIASLFKDQKFANDFMILSIEDGQTPFQIVAKKINDKITNTMNAFFN